MVDENQRVTMDHSYQEIDAAVVQTEANRQAIAALQTSKADSTALAAEATERASEDAKLMAALVGIIDTGLPKNLMPQNSGTTTSGYFCQDLAISVPAGSYMFTANRATAGEFTVVIKSASNAELFRWSRGASPGVTDVAELVTLASDAAKISIFVGNGVTVSDVMICLKAYYDISPAFVPYR